ncbi:RNA-binding protein [Candidatus Woesearchaeota archaeon]|nr:MAG: exosome complex component RRP4 [archaeon GW2011_AR4]MBS3130660.1 RNA-binding protein [Candidatus Woesearchaeota archaeon]HIH37945.1 RNA-binding protein [Candidatus Woesearchaeota archaeon]HIJ03724.1 RNA-binding protein [Candidatus Woesearchaeota archaeon]
MGLLVQEKDIVVPGEEVADGMDYLPSTGTYRDKEKVVSNRLGLVQINGRAIKIVPLTGRYLPKVGDTIIGKVVDVMMSGWRIDTNSAYTAMLSLAEASSDFIPKNANLTKYYGIGDYISCKISNVTSQMLIDISMRGPGLRKLTGGRIISVLPTKVPRIIGTQGSMVSMIKQATNTRIMVGQNGIVHISGDRIEDELLTIKTIRMVEENSHITGLTDMISKFLEEQTRGK